MEVLKFGIFFTCIIVIVTEETDSVSNKRDVHINDKILQLQKLLSIIGNDEVNKREPSIDSAKESEMENKGVDNSNLNIKLTDEDIRALKLLKAKLERQRGNNDQRIVDKINSDNKAKPTPTMGSFYEHELNEDELRKQQVDRIKQLASAILKSDRRDVDTSGSEKSKAVVNPKEGTFGNFRIEVLHKLEERLLQDVDLALRSGFTLDEIMADLEKEESEDIQKERRKENMKSRLLTLLLKGDKP